MASLPSRPWPLLVVAVALLPSAPARAWTEARVLTASAALELQPDGAANVQLDFQVAILGGWLEGLEIAGLDPDLALEPGYQVAFVSEEGERFVPDVSVLSGGRVVLAYARRSAPRRGRYRASLRYRTSLAERATRATGRGTVRFEWTLPGWQSGLDGVSIQVVAPPGATLPEDEAQARASVRVDVAQAGEASLLTFRRAHLPRTVPWTVAFELPDAEVVPALRGPRESALLSAPPSTGEAPAPAPSAPSRAPVALAAAFVALAIAKRLAFGRACRRAGVTPRPLLPCPVPLHAVACIALGAGVVGLSRAELAGWPLPLLGLLLLSVQRPVSVASAPKLGAYRPVTVAELRRARRARFGAWFMPLRWLDASQAPGFALTLAIAGGLHHYCGGLLGPGEAPFTLGHGLVLLGALMLMSPTSRLPKSPEQRIDALSRLARKLRFPLARVPSPALRLVVHEDASGRVQDARLRLCSPVRPRGLVRLDVAWLDRDGIGGHRGEAVLVVVTRAGSPGEAMVEAALPSMRHQSAPGGRRARIVPLRRGLRTLWPAVGSAVEALPVPGSPAPRGTELAPFPTLAERQLAS